MNMFVQDVISNKKFLTSNFNIYVVPIDQVEDKVKNEMSKDSSHIYYYFACS